MDAIKKEYREAADALRCAEVETPEMVARYEAAKAAFDAANPVIVLTCRAWFDLPVAQSCWAADGQVLNA